MTLKEIVEKAERAAVISALEKNEAQMNRTAAQLGITRKNLWEKMRKYAIEKSSFVVVVRNRQVAT